MKTTKIILVFLLTIFYLFLNYFTLFLELFIDKKLDNGNSVSALAKDVSSMASCNVDIIGSLVETTDADTLHIFWCDNQNKDIHFSIYIFTTQEEKQKFLERDTKRKLYFQKNFHSYYNPKHNRNLTRGQPEFYNPCFKHGLYYVVCENANWNSSTGIPKLNAEPYYHEFKGKDIKWKIPL